MPLNYDEPAAGQVVETDEIGGTNFQVIKVAFGDVIDAVRVEHAAPLPARDYHGGTLPYDTGNVGVAAALTLVTVAADAWGDVLLLINLTDEVQQVDVTDGPGNSYGTRTLDPRAWLVIALHGLKFIGGLKLAAGAVGTVAAQFKGTI
jgi:hypothetical protein